MNLSINGVFRYQLTVEKVTHGVAHIRITTLLGPRTIEAPIGAEVEVIQPFEGTLDEGPTAARKLRSRPSR